MGGSSSKPEVNSQAPVSNTVNVGAIDKISAPPDKPLPYATGGTEQFQQAMTSYSFHSMTLIKTCVVIIMLAIIAALAYLAYRHRTMLRKMRTGRIAAGPRGGRMEMLDPELGLARLQLERAISNANIGDFPNNMANMAYAIPPGARQSGDNASSNTNANSNRYGFD